jgi:hypothetical protein
MMTTCHIILHMDYCFFEQEQPCPYHFLMGLNLVNAAYFQGGLGRLVDVFLCIAIGFN